MSNSHNSENSGLPPKAPLVAKSKEPSEELLDLAWKTVQAYQVPGQEEIEEFHLLAAGDATLESALLQLKGGGGRWTLREEEIANEPERWYLKFKCKQDWIDAYQNRAIEVCLVTETFELGTVDRRGIAEVCTKRFSNQQTIKVRIRARE
jgi:hypothetical protein